MLSRLDGRHLLEQILARDETHRGKEGDNTDTDRIVASVAVAINYAILLAVRLLPPSLGRYAAEHDDGKQLKEGDPSVGRRRCRRTKNASSVLMRAFGVMKEMEYLLSEQKQQNVKTVCTFLGGKLFLRVR